MKIAPLWHALVETTWAQPIVVHTGQHYDEAMSTVFLDQFGLPTPHHSLEVGSGSHGAQTGAVLAAYERLCEAERPDFIVVVGDVNSTMACALVAAKARIPLGHLEAGLRSGDRSMPEEINRIVTDALADLLWTPSADGDENLRREGVPAERIVRVGNIMIDCLERQKPAIDRLNKAAAFGKSRKSYGVVTLHRPSNVDNAGTLAALIDTLTAVSETVPLILPLHPRTKARLTQFGLEGAIGRNITCTGPLDYLSFMSLVTDCLFALTDSGGVQEETTYLNIPCLTLRQNTERPVTVTDGTNELVDITTLGPAVRKILAGSWKRARRLELWDGRAAGRIVASLDAWRLGTSNAEASRKRTEAARK
jgi:UDP-N-acetylglucosamine 2-epimerase (non-hydrolysing)